jgi:hypothetical protein
MTGTGIDARPVRRTIRTSVGWLVAGLTAATLVLFVAGVWNPSDLVVLWRFFRNPLHGACLFFALAILASWLIAPIGNEATQTTRARLRVVFVVGLVVSLIAWGLFNPRFAHDYVVLARSGDRAVVLLDQGTDDQRLWVWAGRGWSERRAGDLGRPCGQTRVTFTRADLVHVSTSYREVDLRLDPATGRPLDVLGPTCAG